MQHSRFARYAANCFWLMLPPLAISGLLGGLLPPVFQPDVFWRDIPPALAWPESVLRVLVTGLPLLMPLSLQTPRQRLGAVIYCLGVLAYALAWWPLIAMPDSAWSTSAVGFAAPAYTPLLWLAGIGLIGTRADTRLQRWVGRGYAMSAAGFVVCHILHTLLIHGRHLAG